MYFGIVEGESWIILIYTCVWGGGGGGGWGEEIGAQKMHEGPSRDGEFEECSFAHGWCGNRYMNLVWIRLIIMRNYNVFMVDHVTYPPFH